MARSVDSDARLAMLRSRASLRHDTARSLPAIVIGSYYGLDTALRPTPVVGRHSTHAIATRGPLPRVTRRRRVLRITTLGGFAVQRGADRVLGAAAQPRRMAVLAMIARAGTRGVSRDRLQSILWPEADVDQGKAALKQALYALRRDVDAGDIFLGTHDLRLNPEEVRCDVVEFEDLVRRDEIERAAGVYEGPFLDGFRLASVPEFESWMEDERRTLQHTLAAGLSRLARSTLDRGDATAAVRWARRLAALEPLNAEYTVLLMRALVAAGDQAAALQQERIYQGLVAQELDLPPDPRVVAFAQEIRKGRATPPAGVPVIGVPANDGAPRATPNATIVATPPAATPVAPLSVAVLPFTDGSPVASSTGPLPGLHDETVSALGRTHELRVVARLPGAVVRGGVPDLAAIRGQLGVAAVLEGSVRQAGADVRANIRLVRSSDGVLLWSSRFDRRGDNPMVIEDEIASAIADGVEAALRAEAKLTPTPNRRDRADALYSLGMRAWTPEGAGLGQGLEQFRQAIALDPTHARSHAALAESYTQLAFYGFLPSSRAAELATASADQAMRLAPDLGESHLARGTCLLWVEHEFDAGTEALERALALDPTCVVAQARLAFVRLCHDGPLDSERATAHRAATAAGATGLSRVMYGQQFLAAGRYGEAIEALHSAIDVEAPSFLAYHWLCVSYIEMGLAAEAVAAAVAEASLSGRHPWSLANLVVASVLAGQRRRAETLVESLMARAATGYVQGSMLALAHAALGDHDAAMTFLERAVEDHDPSTMMIRTFPMFRVLHAHPRFRDVLRMAGWRDWDTAELRVPERT